MASLLPLFAFAAFWALSVGGKSAHASALLEGGRSFLMASALWGAAVVALSEILSAFSVLTCTWLAVGWLVIDIAALAALIRSRRLSGAIGAISRFRFPAGWLAKLTILAVATILALLMLLAIIAPPNTVDSLLYHMSRIVHWMQDKNLRPFPAAYQNQIIMPPWAELAILQFRSLSGADRLDNLIQWFSLAASLLVAGCLAEILGNGKGRKLLAISFTISIPMAILQATSTQTDLVAGFWLIGFAFWVSLAKQRKLSAQERLAMFATLGLGMLTKVTFYVYALPLLIWHFLPQIRLRRLREVVREMFLALMLVLILNLGYWLTNIQAFGGPFGSPEFVAKMAGGGFLPSTTPSASATPETESSGLLVRAVSSLLRLSSITAGLELRMMAWNLAWPVQRLQILINIGGRSNLPQIPMGQGEYLSDSLWNHEDTAGNPLHFVLALVAVVLLAWPGGKPIKRELAHYAMAVIAGYLLLPLVVGNASTLYGVRFQLPFFIAMAPVFAEAVARRTRRGLIPGLALGMVLVGLPWVLFNNTRPLIGRRPYTTRIDSILKTPQDSIMFAMRPDLKLPYEAAADGFRQLGCRSLALRIDSHDPEYLFWWLLAAPESGIRIENITPIDVLSRFGDPTFKPCAVICTICGEREEFDGLPLLSSRGNVQLYGMAGLAP
jgi:hypothetical protein